MDSLGSMNRLSLSPSYSLTFIYRTRMVRIMRLLHIIIYSGCVALLGGGGFRLV